MTKLPATWVGAFLLVATSCVNDKAPAPPAQSPAPIVVPVPPRASTATVDDEPDPAQPSITTIAEHVTGVHRLGHALFVSVLTTDEDKPRFRLARVGDDGALTDVATDMPPSQRATMRNGESTISGSPSALLGEPDGPIWMAFEHYSTFGDFEVYRADRGRWSCVGRCPKKPDPEGWGKFSETRMASGEYVANGDLVEGRSRGHLFAIKNRVSNEGDQYVLPHALAQDPARAVKALRKVEGDLVELADGSIVDVATAVPEATQILAVDGQRKDDFWVLDDSGVIHVRGSRHDVLKRPKDASSLVVDTGGAWISGGAIAYRLDRDDTARIAERKAFARVVAARARTLFALDENRLVRVTLP